MSNGKPKRIHHIRGPEPPLGETLRVESSLIDVDLSNNCTINTLHPSCHSQYVNDQFHAALHWAGFEQRWKPDSLAFSAFSVGLSLLVYHRHGVCSPWWHQERVGWRQSAVLGWLLGHVFGAEHHLLLCAAEFPTDCLWWHCEADWRTC